MSAIKFDRQDELNELAAQLFLDTRHKLSKKELLEFVFNIGKRDYDELVSEVNKAKSPHDIAQRKKFIKRFCGVIELGDVDDTDPKSIWVREH